MERRIAEEHLSEYLLRGMKQEEYDLYLLDSKEPDTILTEAVFTRTHENSRGYVNLLGMVPKLTMVSAANVVTQSIIANYCIRFGETKARLGEFIGRGFNVEMKHPISLIEKVNCRIRIDREKDLGNFLFHRSQFQLNDGKFTGEIKGLIPKPV